MADNIDANDFVELDNGDIVKYKDVRDDRTIKYKLISEDSFEEENVKEALK